MENHKVFAMKFSDIYDALVGKAVRKGRSAKEVDELIMWLCGYNRSGLQSQLEKNVEYKTFFDEAPAWNEASKNIKGKICGVQIEAIEDRTMWKIRCLDKIIDELAKGRSVDWIKEKYTII